MSFLKSYFGMGASPAVKPAETPVKPKKETAKKSTGTAIRALPASWYLSQELFELEKRAIFSTRWLLTTHQYRLPNNGDWQKYQMINYHFVVCRDHNGQIKAFHADKDIQHFDVNQSGLTSIHVHVDNKGLIWTNLDPSDTPVAWSEHFGGSDDQERLDYYDWDQYEYDHTWEMEGAYNWKLLGDNYNECYHCRVAHPDLNELADINTYKVVPEKSFLMHFGSPTPDMIARGFKIAPTYFFPNASVNVS
jgi:phenylpropionate dioxygenase-like ring-hydroxylating dioxygenase large terminal subunit